MRRTKTLAVVAAVAAAGTISAISLAGADPKARDSAEGVKGNFSLIMMVHTSSSSFGDLEGVNPWDGSKRETKTTYRYRSIPCNGNAPLNNISSDLPSYNTRVQNSRAPSSLRAHPFSFRVKKVNRRWRLRGSMTLTVCQLRPGPTAEDDPVPDDQKPKIKVRFTTGFKRETAESVRWSGRFKLVDGTGRYDDLSGSGSIAGYFFCFAPEGCAAKGKKYLDGQLVMHGNFKDPTPDLAAP